MRLFLLAFLISLTTLATAQTIYHSNDFADVGDSALVSVVDIVSAGIANVNFRPTGPNQTWDYSDLDPTSQRFKTYVSPSSTGFQLAYITACTFNCYQPCYDNCINNGSPAWLCQPLCTTDCGADCLFSWNRDFSLAELVNDSLDLGVVMITDVFNLYDKSNNRLEQNALGIRIQNIPLVVEYQSPDVIYRFPIQYGDTNSSSSSYGIRLDSIPGTGLNFGFEYKHAQTRTNYVTGWGTLTTPLQTYNNVIKQKSVIINKDSVRVAGNTITLSDFLPDQFLPDTVVEYKWFDEFTKVPVLTATAWRINGNEIYQSVEFVDTLRCFQPLALFGALPIPGSIENGSDSAEVNFYSLSLNVDSFSWDFDDPASANNSSNAQNPTHYYTQPGTYLVTLTACNTGCAAGWCEDITIPVIVVDNRSKDTTTSIIDINEQQIAIYPVPFNDELYISLIEDQSSKTNITILDINGRAVYQNMVKSGNNTLHLKLQHLQSGYYFLHLDTGNEVTIKKLVKN